MKPESDLLSKAFDSLKSQRATFSDFFSQELENRLMQEQQRQKVVRTRRRIVWAAAAVVAVFGSGAVSYAMTDGWKTWPWSISIGADGTVTNQQGDVIGSTVKNEDGSETAIIQMGQGHIELRAEESLKGKNLRLEVGQ